MIDNDQCMMYVYTTEGTMELYLVFRKCNTDHMSCVPHLRLGQKWLPWLQRVSLGNWCSNAWNRCWKTCTVFNFYCFLLFSVFLFLCDEIVLFGGFKLLGDPRMQSQSPYFAVCDLAALVIFKIPNPLVTTHKIFDTRPPKEEIWFFKVLWPQKSRKSGFAPADHIVAGEKNNWNIKRCIFKIYWRSRKEIFEKFEKNANFDDKSTKNDKFSKNHNFFSRGWKFELPPIYYPMGSTFHGKK